MDAVKYWQRLVMEFVAVIFVWPVDVSLFQCIVLVDENHQRKSRLSREKKRDIYTSILELLLFLTPPSDNHTCSLSPKVSPFCFTSDHANPLARRTGDKVEMESNKLSRYSTCSSACMRGKEANEWGEIPCLLLSNHNYQPRHVVVIAGEDT